MSSNLNMCLGFLVFLRDSEGAHPTRHEVSTQLIIDNHLVNQFNARKKIVEGFLKYIPFYLYIKKLHFIFIKVVSSHFYNLNIIMEAKSYISRDLINKTI